MAFRARRVGEVWIRHELLSPGAFGIGANGIAFSPPRDLFVANTDLALVARIPIRPDGRAGEPEVVATGFELLTIDGLAADARSDLHAAMVGASFLGTAPLVRIDPRTGAITPSTTEFGALCLGTPVRRPVPSIFCGAHVVRSPAHTSPRTSAFRTHDPPRSNTAGRSDSRGTPAAACHNRRRRTS